MAARISNGQASKYAEQGFPFKTHNGTLFGDWQGKLFVVWSYGSHWPLFIYHPDTDKWFENSTKSSVTTSRHRTQARPRTKDTLDRDVDWMRRCVETDGVGIKEELLLSSLPLC